MLVPTITKTIYNGKNEFLEFRLIFRARVCMPILHASAAAPEISALVVYNFQSKLKTM